jgi:hypothetical protein
VDATDDLDYYNELVDTPMDGAESMVGKVSGTLVFPGGTSSLIFTASNIFVLCT